ncbi:1-(5-phosphoribosyl)-5-[(5-phosphoribosylamino)methylideneamino]imidazole-4-carboxamide isomerase [Candidatus Raskinella chloraquaticus]|uniref:1-(5-phosphoribosyl)-5-[(5-phosphoribosylamino)methylideneamino] imidazole-4-carboxamide isomerase n=1 Tax=Candidatus Raskinella chloraquaticus TaxID=1951219 RepID=A0A1W9HYQ8_9HYPH|nr:MAG: 1-(5-phosphoribosyl)-5-((5-phosphoribosylamino)methylideneamino)imidazole-4-carboxamide isomerase [Proteobacteria bacterium SG_bin8]
MILFPAIDLKGGHCVRLREGEMASATIFNTAPAAQAASFAADGFSWIHVVDLDGAFAGRSVNRAAVDAIIKATSLNVQLGGGIRDLDAIAGWLSAGVTRVILGTAAARDPALVIKACELYPGRIVVGIDAREGMVAVAGWAETTALSATELAQRFADVGVSAIIFTDIGRDGLLTGLNLAATRALAATTRVPVIASGGLAGMADIEALCAPENACLAGAIAGRALYDGRLAARQALARLGKGAA